MEESERLLEWAFSSFEDVTLYPAGAPVETVPVWLGEEPTVALVSANDIVMTMPHGWRNAAKISVGYNSPAKAPILKGQLLGSLTVTGNGIPPSEVKLVAGRDVARMMLPLRSLAVLEHAVVGG